MFYSYKNMKLHYEMIGDGKPIIILHGLGCNWTLMKSCLEPIFDTQSNYRRIYVDLPGMGQSTASLEFAASDYILELLISFIRNLDILNFLLIGESYGGYLARGILARQFKNVDGMMLLCPVIEPDHSKRTLPLTDIFFSDEKYLNTLTDTERTDFCEYSVLANQYTHQRYKNEVLAGLVLADNNFINTLENNYEFSFNVDEIIRGITYQKPVLFICGKQDKCVGYQDAWRLTESYSRATFSVLDMAGHNLQIEQPHLFNELVIDWLLRIEQA